MASAAEALRSRRAARRGAPGGGLRGGVGGGPAAGGPRGPAALARGLGGRVVPHRDTIDARIELVAPQYPVTQLARMDRALLRCAIGEVLHSPTPARVAGARGG